MEIINKQNPQPLSGLDARSEFASRQGKTLINQLKYWAHVQPQKIAFTFLRDGEAIDHSISYFELYNEVVKVASTLEVEYPAGSRALLLFQTGIDFIVAFMACLYAGVIAVPINTPKPKKLHWERLSVVAANSGASLILISDSQLDSLRELVGVLASTISADILCLSDLKAASTPTNASQFASINNADIAFLQYTSGSTSAPKGVMVSHQCLNHNLELIHSSFAITKNTIFVNWLPLFHDLGLIGNVLQSIYSGSQCYLMTPIAFLQRPFRWLEAISKYKANVSMAPNFAYARCVESITEQEKIGLDLTHWTLALNGAEPIRPETLVCFEESFKNCGFKSCSFFPAYGLAEGTLIVTASEPSGGHSIATVEKYKLAEKNEIVLIPPHHKNSKILVSCGKPRGGQTICIVNTQTYHACEPNMVGEVWVSGESVAAGYWQNSALTQATFRAAIAGNTYPDKLFLRTGDLGFFINEELYIVGRLKEIIIIRGQNYYPYDIEQMVEGCDSAIKENGIAAFALEDNDSEGIGLAIEVERTHIKTIEYPALIKKIKTLVSEQFDLNVSGISFIKPMTLPRTSSGKIQRNIAQQAYIHSTLSELHRYEAAVLPEQRTDANQLTHNNTSYWMDKGNLDESDVHQWLTSRLTHYLNMEAHLLDSDAPISEYGLDSSVAISLSAEIGVGLGKPQDPNLLWLCPNINALIEHMMRELETTVSEPAQ